MYSTRVSIAAILIVAALVLVPLPQTPRVQAQQCANVLEALSDASDYNFTRTVQAVHVAGLTEMLTAKGAFTVFAPDEQAFAKIPAWQVTYAMKHKGIVTNLIEYHIVSGVISAAQLERARFLPTLGGRALPVTVRDGTVVLNGVAKVLNTGTSCANGIVYAIDTVLRP